MLNFLFRNRKTHELKVETQRQTFERLIEELNAAIDHLPEKPKVTFDPANGHIAFEPPEQFPDEALALPKPAEEPAPEAAAPSDAGPEDKVEAESEGAETSPKAAS